MGALLCCLNDAPCPPLPSHGASITGHTACRVVVGGGVTVEAGTAAKNMHFTAVGSEPAPE
jgi:hypothetical protein